MEKWRPCFCNISRQASRCLVFNGHFRFVKLTLTCVGQFKCVYLSDSINLVLSWCLLDPQVCARKGTVQSTVSARGRDAFLVHARRSLWGSGKPFHRDLHDCIVTLKCNVNAWPHWYVFSAAASSILAKRLRVHATGRG